MYLYSRQFLSLRSRQRYSQAHTRASILSFLFFFFCRQLPHFTRRPPPIKLSLTWYVKMRDMVGHAFPSMPRKERQHLYISVPNENIHLFMPGKTINVITQPSQVVNDNHSGTPTPAISFYPFHKYKPLYTNIYVCICM
ncbi:hypothetical protein, unlikely [Trypanosoma brucei gambiense DAL972]|uniref:Uncharacterized protein n=1 Tax=Trypanosoma brucei gambiense (strain MHOM/CI/86/DAL972) TaxID=679716 RepID=C9ZRT1_TRYB9|nr:hypothetical protein, unlikely [Trypanosoma brucei gambiense DAL972]CBH12067.1 hypothetical protein, unlikely [Trypanosoma brucei gambiense DAL972]|eukprot:XP_011774350.1 hypothetical protein, unlikely [Trypanosoma brucei gambiense DAL972]